MINKLLYVCYTVMTRTKKKNTIIYLFFFVYLVFTSVVVVASKTMRRQLDRVVSLRVIRRISLVKRTSDYGVFFYLEFWQNRRLTIPL